MKFLRNRITSKEMTEIRQQLEAEVGKFNINLLNINRKYILTKDGLKNKERFENLLEVYRFIKSNDLTKIDFK